MRCLVRIALVTFVTSLGAAPALAQSVTLEQTLSAPAGRLGFTNAMAIQGDRMLIGSNTCCWGAGSADLCERVGGVWSCSTPLAPFGSEDSTSFGTGAELDGDYAFVSAYSAEVDSGAVYVFHRNGDGTWTGTQRLTETPRDPNDALFGFRLHSEGTTLVVSAWYYGRSTSNFGRVVVFERDGAGDYVQQLFFASPDSNSNLFGIDVDFDGSRILASDLTGVGGGPSVYLLDYAWTGSAATATARSQVYDTATYSVSGSGFGRTVRLTDFGDIIIANHQKTVGGMTNAGEIIVVDETTGTERARFDPTTPAENGYFGTSMAVDGPWMAASNKGSAEVYYRSATGWAHVTTLADGGADFGLSVAISGRTLLVGEPTTGGGTLRTYYLAPPAQDDGEPCRGTGECASGECVDGVCCDVACAGECSSCVASETGGTDGTCAPVLAGRMDDACGDGMCGACDGAGACDPTAECDAGMPDAGTDPGTDAGPISSDGGSTGNDAGPVSSDAGGPIDADMGEDAGPTVPRIDVGCVCGQTARASSPNGLLLVGLALFLVGRRRRRR